MSSWNSLLIAFCILAAASLAIASQEKDFVRIPSGSEASLHKNRNIRPWAKSSISPAQRAARKMKFSLERKANISEIIGGYIAPASTAKHVAYIQVDFWSGTRSACTGSVLTKHLILTAAHCFEGSFNKFDVDRVLLTVGATSGGGTVYEAYFVDIHSKYNPITIQNDVAIIWISGELDAPATGVYLPSKSFNLPDRTIVYAAGFGKTSNRGSGSTVLLEARLRYQAYKTCEARWPSRLTDDWSSRRIMCATDPNFPNGGSAATCQGDSGGPLFTKRSDDGILQHGITSFGGTTCAAKGANGWYVNAKNYQTVIFQYANQDFRRWREVYRLYLH